MKPLKKVTYSKLKLNSKVINHFEEIGRFEYSESKYDSTEIKTKFEFEFTDVDINDNGKFLFIISYDLDYNQAIDKDLTMVYSVNNKGEYIEEYELVIKPDNNNPEKQSLSTILSEIANKQDKTDHENDESAKAIEQTNEWLFKNAR